MRVNLISLLVVLLLFLNFGSAYADDTEIYFSKNIFDKNRAKPNILFLLDNSKDMQVKPRYVKSSAGGNAYYGQPYNRLDFAKELITELVTDINFDFANIGIVTFPSNTTNNFSEMLYPIRDIDSFTKGEVTCVNQSQDSVNECSKIQWYQTLATPFSDADYTNSSIGGDIING